MTKQTWCTSFPGSTLTLPDGTLGKGPRCRCPSGYVHGGLGPVHCALAALGTLGVRPSSVPPQAMPPLRTGTASETRATGCSPLRGRPGGTLPGSVVERPQPSKGVQRRAVKTPRKRASALMTTKPVATSLSFRSLPRGAWWWPGVHFNGRVAWRAITCTSTVALTGDSDPGRGRGPCGSGRGVPPRGHVTATHPLQPDSFQLPAPLRDVLLSAIHGDGTLASVRSGPARGCDCGACASEVPPHQCILGRLPGGGAMGSVDGSGLWYSDRALSRFFL